MGAPLVNQSAAEYFKELVDESLARQHVRAGDLTAFYLVNLLCQFIRLETPSSFGPNGEPLAFRLVRAFESGSVEQRSRLRSLGDFSLFMSGFFADSFNRRAVDVDYYITMGEYAYGALGRRDDETFGNVFTELARKFVGFTDVLADISERTALAPRAEMLRLYEKWLRTGSSRDGQKLIDRGIIPNSSIGRRFIQ